MNKSEFEQMTGHKDGLGAAAILEDDGTWTAIITFFSDGKAEYSQHRKGFSSESSAVADAVKRIEEVVAPLVESGMVTAPNLVIKDRLKEAEGMVH